MVVAARNPKQGLASRPKMCAVAQGAPDEPPNFKGVKLISKIKLTARDVTIERVSHPASGDDDHHDDQLISLAQPSPAFEQAMKTLATLVAAYLRLPLPDTADAALDDLEDEETHLDVNELRLEWKLNWLREAVYCAEIFMQVTFSDEIDPYTIRVPKLLNRQRYEKGRAPLLPEAIARQIDLILQFAQRFYDGGERAARQLSLINGGLDDE